MTLFEAQQDLSENIVNVNRTMKTSRFDIYTLESNSNVTIQHHQLRKKPELIKDSLYVAGEAYDSFDVWVNKGIQSNHASLFTCIAENLSTFSEALQIAEQYNA